MFLFRKVESAVKRHIRCFEKQTTPGLLSTGWGFVFNLMKYTILKGTHFTSYKEIASSLMNLIDYDLKRVDRHNPEAQSLYHAEQISKAAELFFSNNPECIDTLIMYEIATGDSNDNTARFGWRKGYNELSKALEDYTNSLI